MSAMTASAVQETTQAQMRAPHLLAEPRGQRQPVPAGLLRRPQHDPVLAE